jgi:hypothetical protein
VSEAVNCSVKQFFALPGITNSKLKACEKQFNEVIEKQLNQINKTFGANTQSTHAASHSCVTGASNALASQFKNQATQGMT